MAGTRIRCKPTDLNPSVRSASLCLIRGCAKDGKGLPTQFISTSTRFRKISFCKLACLTIHTSVQLGWIRSAMSRCPCSIGFAPTTQGIPSGDF